MGSNFYEARLQISQRRGHRESFDLNREIVKGRVAIRLAGLNERLEFRQRPAWERAQRIYGSITAVLAENRRSTFLGPTILRANGEYGDIASNPPNPVPPSDGFTSWCTLPSRDLQQYTGTVFPVFYDNGTFTPRQTINNLTRQSINAHTVIPYFLQFAAIYPGPGAPTQYLNGVCLLRVSDAAIPDFRMTS
jgi:hypothetical protein